MTWTERAWVFTSAEAADLVTSVIEKFRRPMGREASDIDNTLHPRLRAELIAQISLLIDVDEAVRAELRAPSRVGPDRPELRDTSEEWIPNPGDRRAFPIAARWRPEDAG